MSTRRRCTGHWLVSSSACGRRRDTWPENLDGADHDAATVPPVFTVAGGSDGSHELPSNGRTGRSEDENADGGGYVLPFRSFASPQMSVVSLVRMPQRSAWPGPANISKVDPPHHWLRW
ncbi:hypothetical protein B296_00021803 [Ensete ventricosum]|uniref:Uncharacterized protein n=1 Tax=Ensete ventricosum TaxID=4639 RepID=A0A426ZUS4_ENSVE|nr:hypothetical protein B296_00021803 [Ensete ventricosum]